MFAIPGAKLARKEDIGDLFHRALLSQRGESVGTLAQPACRALTSLRAVVTDPPTTQSVHKGLITYIAALEFIHRTVGPVSLPHPVLWVHAFDADATHSAQSLTYERICVLYNLGVCSAVLARDAHRGIDNTAAARAGQQFRLAAGAFAAAARAAAEPDAVTAIRGASDLSPAALDAAQNLMLANAQQILLLQADAQPPSAPVHQARASFAAGAAHYYRTAAECCANVQAQDAARLESGIGKPAAALAKFFEARAQFAMAAAHDAQRKMPEQLTRLNYARAACDVALVKAKEIDVKRLRNLGALQNELLDAIKVLDSDLADRAKMAAGENRYVYGNVDPARAVPNIPTRHAEPTDVAAVVSRAAVDERLAPLEQLPSYNEARAEQVAKKYTAMVENTVGAEVAALRAAGGQLAHAVALAAAAVSAAREASVAGTQHNAQSHAVKEDERVIEAVRIVRDQGGVSSLRELQAQATGLARDAKKMLLDVESELTAEEAEDRAARARAPMMQRPLSKDLTGEYYERLQKSQVKVDAAANADGVIDHQISYHSEAIVALDAVDLQGLPPKPRPARAGVRSQDLSETERLIARGRQLGIDQEALVAEFDTARRQNSPVVATAKIAPGPGAEGRLTALVNQTYGEMQRRGQALRAEMTDAAQRVTECSGRLAVPQADPAEEDARQRMAALYRGQAAAIKCGELLSHLRDGIAFYSKEQDTIRMLYNDVQGFRAARNEDAAQYASQQPQRPQYQQQQQPPAPPPMSQPSSGYGQYNSMPYEPNPPPPLPPSSAPPSVQTYSTPAPGIAAYGGATPSGSSGIPYPPQHRPYHGSPQYSSAPPPLYGEQQQQPYGSQPHYGNAPSPPGPQYGAPPLPPGQYGAPPPQYGYGNQYGNPNPYSPPQGQYGQPTHPSQYGGQYGAPPPHGHQRPPQ